VLIWPKLDNHTERTGTYVVVRHAGVGRRLFKEFDLHGGRSADSKSIQPDESDTDREYVTTCSMVGEAGLGYGERFQMFLRVSLGADI
jgi:hypothetical protein